MAGFAAASPKASRRRAVSRSAGTKLVARHSRPIRRTSKHLRAYDRDFDIEWHGNDVMSIRPEGEQLPVFGPRAEALRTAAADTGACVEAFDN